MRIEEDKVRMRRKAWRPLAFAHFEPCLYIRTTELGAVRERLYIKKEEKEK